MAVVGFIGLGNMGLPMAQNLMRAGHRLRGFDVVPACLEAGVAAGAQRAGSAADAAAGAEVVITMLPEGRHVREVYLGAEGVLARSDPAALLIDCSTIDVATARAVNQAASELGLEVLDAPVSGGVAGAENAALTFMVGGSEAGFGRAQPILQTDGQGGDPYRPLGQWPGGQDLQQHAARDLDDRRRRGVRAGRAARAQRRQAVRGQPPVVRPVLVAHQLLPGAGARAQLPGEPGLSGGLHRGDDGQGSAAGAGCGPERRRADPARCPGAAALRPVHDQRAGRAGLLRDHQDAGRRVVNKGCKSRAGMLVIR